MINKKGILHTIISAFLIVSLTIIPAPKKAHATGFPVIDLANIVQMLVDMGMQIAQQAEMITTAVNSGLSVIEQIKEYVQMLEEYETTLTNLKDLGDAIASGDFEAAYGIISNSNLTEFVNEDLVDLSGDMLDVWVAVDDARRGKFGGAKAIEDILNEVSELYPDNPDVQEIVEISQNRQTASTSSAALSDIQLTNITKFENSIEKQEQLIDGLGEQSELATLQALAQALVFQSKLKVSEMRYDAAKSNVDISIGEIYSRNMAKAIENSLANTQEAINAEIDYVLDE